MKKVIVNQKIVSLIIEIKVVILNSSLRAGLYAGWELAFRLPITAAD